MSTKTWVVVVDSDTGETFHIDEADADVHVEHTPGRERVTLHVRRKGAGGEWPPRSAEEERARIVALLRARAEEERGWRAKAAPWSRDEMADGGSLDGAADAVEDEG